MSIASEITRINTNIANSYTAVDGKGGTLPATQNSANLAAAINSIEVIESATAEGESLSLTNTKAMPYSDYVVKGKSEQATRSGKNKMKTSSSIWKSALTSAIYNSATDEFTFHRDNGTDYLIDFNKLDLEDNTTYYIKFVVSENTMEANFLDIKSSSRLTGNISIPAGQTGTFDFTLASGSGTQLYDLWLYCNSTGTLKTKIMISAEQGDYEPYGVSPSPDYPSEIHSVADDVNLWNGDATSLNNVTYSNGVVTQIQADTATYIIWKVNFYNNSTYVKQILTTKNDTGIITFEINKDNTFDRIRLGLNGARIDSNMLINLSFLEDNKTYTLSFNITNVTQGSISWQDIKFQEGSIATPYSPYNQGTVTTKQRGKNLWTSSLPIIFSDGYSIVQDNNNGGIDMTIASSTSFGYRFYDLGLISDFAGKTLTFSISNEPNALYRYCAFIACNADGSNRQELKNFYKNNQITYTIGNSYSQTHLAVRLYIAEGTGGQTYSINNVQVEEKSEKTDYEPYQGYDYTIQTEPLRSLPNGVKDTIEAEQHRKIGRQTGTLTETTTITLSDAKTNGAYMCNIKPSGTLTGKTIELEAGDYEIIYELETEIIEPLTQNQATTMLNIIKTGSYEGTTNIYTDEDVKPTMKADYYKKK